MSNLSHGRLSDLVRVLPDALQEVLKVRHGDLLDLLTEFGERLGHDLAKAILADPRYVDVLQLFHGLQCRIVSDRGRTNSRTHEMSTNRWTVQSLSLGLFDIIKKIVM